MSLANDFLSILTLIPEFDRLCAKCEVYGARGESRQSGEFAKTLERLNDVTKFFAEKLPRQLFARLVVGERGEAFENEIYDAVMQ